VIWEATTARDELAVSTWNDVRRSARGSGLGFALHRSLLPLGERIEGRIYRDASAILAMSAHTRDRVIETHGLAAGDVGILPHPAGPAFLEALDAARREPGERMPGEPWRLLFVGRADDARKNFALLPSVLRQLSAAGHAVTLTVVGPHNAEWRAGLSLDDVADSIHFTGPVSTEALVSAYLHHDLLLLPSRQEGFGIVVAEAFAAGMPVVATRCGGPEAVIAESGAGELVPIDASAMAAAVVRILAEARSVAEMRRRARVYADGPLNPSRFAEQVARITWGIIRQRAPVTTPAPVVRS
jgi:glycosyltransferase involved in cell wall biosynthesis